MIDNILRINFNGKTSIESKPLYQYDYGQKIKFLDLTLPSIFEVHFANRLYDNSITMVGTNNEVEIPDECFESGLNIYVWIYLHVGADDGETEYQIIIPIIKRAKPSNAEPSSAQLDIIEQTLAALTGGVREAVGAANVALAAASSADLACTSAQEYMLAAQSYALTAESACDSAVAIAASIMGLPAVTSADNGKILCVVDGEWAVVSLPSVNGEDHSGGNN